MRRLILPLLLLALAVLVAWEIRRHRERRARRLAFKRWHTRMQAWYAEALEEVGPMPNITLEDKERRAIAFTRLIQKLPLEEENGSQSGV